MATHELLEKWTAYRLANGWRRTPAREAIVGVLARVQAHGAGGLTLDDWLSLVRGACDRATLYRTLEALSETGLVMRQEVGYRDESGFHGRIVYVPRLDNPSPKRCIRQRGKTDGRHVVMSGGRRVGAYDSRGSASSLASRRAREMRREGLMEMAVWTYVDRTHKRLGPQVLEADRIARERAKESDLEDALSSVRGQMRHAKVVLRERIAQRKALATT